MDYFEERRETILVMLEEMERWASGTGDYDLQAQLRTMIQIVIRLQPMLRS